MHTQVTTGSFSVPVGGIEEVACWAHARRRFFDARSNAPREANQFLEWIQQLYDVEDRARELTPIERQMLRQRESAPILDRIERYLESDHLRTGPVGRVAPIRGRQSADHRQQCLGAVGVCLGITAALECRGNGSGTITAGRWAATHPEHVLRHRLDESRRKATRQQKEAR